MSNTSVDDLVSHLKQRHAFLSEEAKCGLEERKRQELDFHNVTPASVQGETKNDHSANEKPLANKKFYKTTRLSHEYIEQWMAANCRGKVFLDYACGDGQMTLQAAELGAILSVGLDISDGRIRDARESASKRGLSPTCFFIQGDCERTGFPDCSFDVVLCSGMLHHLDLSYALPEIRRILKPGGKALAIEAFGENPVIQAYRNWTPELRTPWEKDHILRAKDLRFASNFFQLSNVNFWHMTSPISAFLPKPLAELGLAGCNTVDRILTKVPILKWWSWQVTFEMIKQSKGD
jgi:ubiquinone/menaquinone biosynthesis C-methylase UbiE